MDEGKGERNDEWMKNKRKRERIRVNDGKGIHL
jgi:hypothetical protein